MGAFLNRPVTEHDTHEEGAEGELSFGVSAMQGWRRGMEDAHLAQLALDQERELSLFGVFDGHGGPEVAQYAATYMPEVIEATGEYQKGDYVVALKRAFMNMDVCLRTESGRFKLLRLASLENRKRKLTIQDLDLTEAKNAAESCGLTLEQLKAILVSQAKLEARRVAEERQKEKRFKTEKRFEMEKIAEEREIASVPIPPLTPPPDTQQRHTPDERTKDDDDEKQFSDSSSSGFSSPPSPLKETPIPASPAKTNGERPSAVAGRPQRPNTLRRRTVGVDSGTTAVVALVVGRRQVLVANAGDSRCVVSRQGRAIDLSKDHKPDDEFERRRIEIAGGRVMDGRVEGNLNLSRALGDFLYKRNQSLRPDLQMITAMPDVRSLALKPGDDFMVLACDGIWNCLSSQQVVSMVRERLGKQTLGRICEEVCDRCLARDNNGDGLDNMTMMVVRFPLAHRSQHKLPIRQTVPLTDTCTNQTQGVATAAAAEQSQSLKKRRTCTYV
uniref:protein-serine/threonine phosphatase n=1 Tax=Octactis speculum TaxID=3111310 RepID=A0A7S2B869_9STRA|mmetsp:Transcript_20603/g.27979  ORF Transcript_20603/g.27979 Transcript_20603/m.27979 type:complete len:500 (+) Transcript_20603:53-1552(+)